MSMGIEMKLFHHDPEMVLLCESFPRIVAALGLE